MKGIEGSTLGRYELHHRLARGGMSEVYLGYDRRVKRRVAVKVLYGSDEPFVRRFEREALAVGALTHANILPLYDFGEQRPWYYLVMPFVEGGTLRDYLYKRERLTLEEAGSFLEQIASALQYAHDHDVVHRDVKPSNILLRPNGHAYLGDFGLAKAKMEAESLTHSGTMIGTPEYMAPEQSDGVNDYRSDIYSLGIILYQMLTGQVPFTAESPVAVTLRHIQTPPIPPRKLNDAIPPSIEDIILKALEKQPAQRYQQARLFAADYRRRLWEEHMRESGGQPCLFLPGEALPDKGEKVEAVYEENEPPLMVPSLSTGEALTQSLTQLPEQQIALLNAPTPLFPLTGEAPAFPSIPRLRRRKSRFIPLLMAILCLLVFTLIVPLLLVQQSNQRSNEVFKAQQTTSAQKARRHATRIAEMATATGQARAKTQAKALAAQATLAAQARVQAVTGITAGMSAGPVLYANALTAPAYGWLNDHSQCSFHPQGYRVHTHIRGAAWCYFNQRIFSNAIITVNATLLAGDVYGIIFRLNPANKAYYVLELNSFGEYRFVRAYESNPYHWLTLIDWTYSNTIYRGYGSTNSLLIAARDDHFSFYINRQLVMSSFSDSVLSSGFIGFLVASDHIGNTTATFTDLWVLQ